MKIRTKIILISSTAVFVTILLMGMAVRGIVGKSSEKEAFVQAYQNTYLLMKEAESIIEAEQDEAQCSVRLNYFFKTYQKENPGKSEYFICVRTETDSEERFRAEEEIFNNTELEAKELIVIDSYERAEDTSVLYTLFSYEGREYWLFMNYKEPGIAMFRLEDITYLKEDMRNLTAVLSLTAIGIMLVTVLGLAFILRRVFEPLQKLNDSAKQIAEGVYDKRAEVHNKDEVGQLGISFNRMAEAVETHMKQLEESERRKTLFMGNLAHELKTPMTAISGYAQMLLAVKLSEEEREEALGYIYAESGRLERLSRKMMRLMELDYEKEFEFRWISAAELFDMVWKSSKEICSRKQIELVCIENGEQFRADADLMLEVLINLVDNGIKASEPGNRIIVSASEHCISVEDFGRGIPKEEQEHIFEPFYMADKSRSRKNGGAGLGLALTALIARQHNIEIHIESEEGKGTKINLQFVYNTMNT